jgi:hypothetical protein
MERDENRLLASGRSDSVIVVDVASWWLVLRVDAANQRLQPSGGSGRSRWQAVLAAAG